MKKKTFIAIAMSEEDVIKMIRGEELRYEFDTETVAIRINEKEGTAASEKLS